MEAGATSSRGGRPRPGRVRGRCRRVRAGRVVAAAVGCGPRRRAWHGRNGRGRSRANVILTDRARLDGSAAAAGCARIVRVGDFERFEVEGRLGRPTGHLRAGRVREAGGRWRICRLVASQDEAGSRAFTLDTEARRTMLVLDPDQDPSPVGVVGEIYVAGEGWRAATSTRPGRRPKASSRTRTPRSRARDSSDRTGRAALGRRRRAVVGRATRRIKVGGSLVSLDDVTSVIVAPSRVLEAYVAEHDAGYEGRRLVAYVAPREGAAGRGANCARS